ncbi:MAG: PAS domain-containing sensor histidine kinase, partial [Candidatus Omnitrophica bacterium]|nr:PAS domain-containing sensor histidine kinase [Candidatus Omnitrophota bacterium]
MDKKWARGASREEERKYRDFVENVNSIILRMDTKGRITFLNKFAQRFFGYKKSELLGHSVIGTIVPFTDSAGHDLKKMISDIMLDTDRHINNENENMLRDGQRVWIAWTNRAIFDKDSREKEIICVGNDISKIKKAEELLEEMDRRKSAFVANVSHEFKNPLGIIRASMDNILDGIIGPVSPQQKEVLEIAKRNVERLMRLVTDLLDISKIEAGKMELRRERVEMGPLVNEVVAGNGPDVSKKNLAVKKNISK